MAFDSPGEAISSPSEAITTPVDTLNSPDDGQGFYQCHSCEFKFSIEDAAKINFCGNCGTKIKNWWIQSFVEFANLKISRNIIF